MTTNDEQELAQSLGAAQRELPSYTEVPSDHATIARRAYELYEARGRAAGFELDDWLRAERELQQSAKR